MKRSKLFTVLAGLIIVMMAFGLTQAQNLGGFTTLLTGQVTAGDDSMPVPNFKMKLTFKNDTVSFRTLIMTDENGFYSQTVLKNNTYTLTSLDTFTYYGFTEDIEVKELPVEHNIHLMKRTDLVNVNGSVVFNGNPVETNVYFLKIPDDVDLNDFREFEAYFKVPKPMLKWASYETSTDASGNFMVEMIPGKYVVHIPADHQAGYLNYWAAFQVTGDTTLDAFNMKELKTISGHVNNADQYDMVMIYAHPLRPSRPFMASPDSVNDFNLEVAPGTYILRCVAYFDDFKYMVFYDSVFTAKEATKIEVQDDVSGIVFNLPEPIVYPFSVSGTVTSRQSGLPLEGANVAFVSYNFMSNLWQGYEATTDAQGYYKVEGYTMLKEDSLVGFAWKDSTFFAQFYKDKATMFSADPIIYHANEDVTGIDFALDTIDTQNGFSISGMLMNEKGEPIPMGQVTAYTTATNVGVITAQVDSTGHYAFDPVFPTGSVVYLTAWGGFDYLPEIYNDAKTWKEADAIFIQGSDVTGINFILEEKKPMRLPLAKIKGWIKSQIGNLAKASATDNHTGAIVYVRPEGEKEWTSYTYVKSDGSFNIPVESDGVYEYLVTEKDGSEARGTITVENLEAEVTVEITSIADPSDNLVIKTDQLFDAYPNPFNPSTTIKVQMAQNGPAKLVVYNVLGQKVKTLFDGSLQAGSQKFVWNGKDDNGRQVASGLYFYQLKTQNTVQTKAVMFLK